MNYQMLLLAHDAFYKFEKRANDYDTFMAKKEPEQWNTRDLPLTEVDNLFRFVRRWDRFFTGKESLFQEIYSQLFTEIQHLSGKRFLEIDLDDNINQLNIETIFDAFSRCNMSGQYESTAASKLAHAMNPDLFIMWDTNIREGHVGSQEEKDASIYISKFLPLMKNELAELLNTCTINCELSKTKAYELLEVITGNRIPKLIDQYNYMNFTMPTEFKSYLGNISIEEKQIMSIPFKDSVSFWKNRVTTRTHRDRKRTAQFIDIINQLRTIGKITAKERLEYNEKWKKYPEDRDELFNHVTHLFKKS